MPLSLHAALVPGWLQILGSVEGLVAKAESWCDDNGYSHDEIIGARLAGDMLPFSYQVKSCWAHSAHALDGAAKGRFEPHMDPPPDSFAGLREVLAAAKSGLSGCDADALDAIAGNDMVFAIGDKLRLEFTVQDFLLGFSSPNFHFHAATAYGILRMKGLEIGKRDYLGALPVKG